MSVHLPIAERARTRLWGALAALTLATTGLMVGGIASPAPAGAAETMPRVLLTGGAAEVERTYTATPSSAWPESVSLSYQWYRGDHEATKDSFVPIENATGQRYKLTDADHWHTIKVTVTVSRDGAVVGQVSSATTNWIMYNMAPPVLTGVPQVGHTITATLGPWATEWETSLWWRRTGVPIPGETGLTYKVRPADAGKEISLLAIGEYTFPNGVHPIDRYASRMRMSWGTKSVLRAGSPARGVLRVTTIPYAAGAVQSQVRGQVALYDGTRLLKQYWVTEGRRTLTFKHLRRGPHAIKMVFIANPWYAGSQATHTFTVR